MKPIIECVPNVSEGSNYRIIEAIASEIRKTKGVKLLHVDSHKDANRSVFTFAGVPEAVVEAAFRLIQKSVELIDMRYHKGLHPRMGAVDVCPLVPIQGISMEETAELARKLGQRVGEELRIPVYLYETSATSPLRKRLEDVRKGEYEGLPKRIAEGFLPDYGKAEFNPKTGAVIVGARPILVAYNVNLATKSVSVANEIASEIRESGRILKENGIIQRDENGKPIRVPGICKAVKAIGWYLESYGRAQVSMNLTDIEITPVHVAFEEVCRVAEKHGTYVTGSELVGLAPLRVFRDAANFYKQFIGYANKTLTEEEIVNFAAASLGLDDMDANFNPFERVLEYQLKELL
ncbi:MAG: glutamate formimidoyltransferase [Cytophagales bacterium]|nr:glutamate formimidoyltransferase [Cytophagales bacterium]MDW8384887.1 glutamate formimidoyltransferase [Flammeovirgaceae bacterium]